MDVLNNPGNGARLAYTFDEFAKATKLSVGFLRLEAERKHLRVTRLGRRVRILVNDALAYLEAGRAEQR